MTYLFATTTNYKNGKLTGAHRRFLELVKEFSKTSKVILISGDISQSELNENITWHKIENPKIKFLPYHLSGMLHISRQLHKLKKNLKYDIAVSFSPMITICYKKAGIKNIVTLFREDVVGYQKSVYASKFRIWYFGRQERKAVKASQKVIVQCKSDRDNLISRNKKYYKDIESKVYVQINNANASWMKTELIFKQKNNDAVKVLFIGNFSDKRKGHQLLLPASARLLDEGVKFELLIAGDGSELEWYQSKYSKYLSIKFLGRVNEMEKYLSQSDFMIVPSLIDSCPNTVLEGLNAGIAVYGAKTGGIPDLLVNDEYMFEPTEEGIYSFLKNVLQNERFVTDSATQSERKKSLTFDWGKQIADLIMKE